MHKKTRLFTFWGILFTFFAGVLLHFVYEWSGQNPWVGLFAPVSESTWEHMKLVFFPMLFYTMFFCRKWKTFSPDFCSVSACGILLGTLSVPVLFYTYSGILGAHFLFADILVFLCSLFIGFFFIYHAVSKQKYHFCKKPAIILIFLAMACFFLFTFFPPSFGIFSEKASSASGTTAFYLFIQNHRITA